MLDKQNGELPEENEEISEKAFVKNAKETLAKFWDKVNPIKYEDEDEEEIPEVEEAPAEEPAQEEKVPARRKPADAFAIDFAFDEVVKTPAQEGTPAEEESADEPAEEETAEEAPAEETAVEETAEEAPAEDAVVPVEEAVVAEEDLFAEEEVPEAPAKKKLKKWQLGMIISVCTLLLVVLVAFILKGAGVSLKPRENNLQYKDSYAADESALVKDADTVVATLGEHELTVSELQLYYMQGIYTFYSQNQYYLSMIGLDLTKPLAEQPYLGGEEEMTWEQYFLDAALKSWQSYTVVELLAQQEDFQVADEVQAQLDSMAPQLNDIAAAYGYASAAEYLSKEMAPGISPETYVNFNQVYIVCNEYINHYYENNYPDGKEITLYYKANEDVFNENGVSRDMGQIASVRHILIQPQGGVTDDSGTTTYSEEEWAATLTEAERVLQLWKDGEATEESFAELANTYSKDGGSNTTGGLYTGIHIDANYVPEFKNWAIDFSRNPGDTEIVKTTYGYHIMYFVEGENYFNHVVGDQLVAERVQSKLAEVKNAYPMEVDYKKIILCESVF